MQLLPVTCAFSVESIVTSEFNVCAFVLNKPPTLKFPLFSSAGVIEPLVDSKKYTKILFVPLEGAAVKVSVDPSGTV